MNHQKGLQPGRTTNRRLPLAGVAFGMASLLSACSNAGIYANVDSAGPAVGLGQVHASPALNLGYQLSTSPGGF